MQMGSSGNRREPTEEEVSDPMAVNLGEDARFEIDVLLTEAISSLEGVAAIMAELGEEEASPSIHARLHALRDVVAVCQSRLETAASMLDM